MLGVKSIGAIIKWVVILIIALIGVFSIRKLIKNKTQGKVEETFEKIVEEAKNEVSDQRQASLKLIANQIWVILDKVRTDEEALYQAFAKIKTNQEMQMVVGLFSTKKEKSLREWIRKRLNQKEITKLNVLLADKGLSMQF